MDAVLLFFACAETLCALERVQSDVVYSTVLQFYSAVQFGLCRSQWNGCAKAGMVLVLQSSLAILIVFCSGTATSRMQSECYDLHETLCFFGSTEVPLRRKVDSRARRS